MKLTFNKDNWSGEDITINVNQNKKTFGLYGYDFKLKKDATASTALFEKFDVFSPDFHRGEYPVATVTKFTDDDFWEAYDFDNHPLYGGISRTAKNMYEAVTKYLCNVI